MTEAKFSRYDLADYLETQDDIVAYLEAVMEEGDDDPAHLMRALRVVAVPATSASWRAIPA